MDDKRKTPNLKQSLKSLDGIVKICKKFLNLCGHCETVFCIVYFLNFTHEESRYLHKYDGHEWNHAIPMYWINPWQCTQVHALNKQ